MRGRQDCVPSVTSPLLAGAKQGSCFLESQRPCRATKNAGGGAQIHIFADSLPLYGCFDLFRMTTGVVFLRFLREQHSGPFRPPPSLLWAMLTSFGLLLLLLVKAILCYKGEETSLANISFLRNLENTPADLRRRFLRGTGNFVLSTSDTNGGQIIGGVPWPSQSDRVPSPADRANYAQQVNELLNANYFVVRLGKKRKVFCFGHARYILLPCFSKPA